MPDELQNLRARVCSLEDRQAILDTLYAYGHALDYGDEALWLDCWSDDAELYWPRVGAISGREAFVAAFRDHTHAPDRYHKHFLTMPVIQIEGDAANVVSYFARLDVDGDETYIYSFGRYRDVLRRCAPGQWRFRERRLEVEGRHALSRS